MDKRARRRGEPAVTEVFFILGAILVLIGLIYSMKKSWPSFDPLALAMLIGIGLLLVVVCERLRILVSEVARIGDHLERLASQSESPVEPEETSTKGRATRVDEPAW